LRDNIGRDNREGFKEGRGDNRGGIIEEKLMEG
jgi:hypothetical protein